MPIILRVSLAVLVTLVSFMVSEEMQAHTPSTDPGNYWVLGVITGSITLAILHTGKWR